MGTTDKMLWQVLALLLVPLLPAGLSAVYHRELVRSSREAAGSLVDSAVASAQAVLWVDARNEGERTKRPLSWALRLTEETWEQDLESVLMAWEPGTVIVVFCDEGPCSRSRQVAQRLTAETRIKSVMAIPGGEPEALRLHRSLLKVERLHETP